MIDDYNIEIDLKDCIGPAYYKMFWDMEDKNNTHYVCKGGRGSLKSSYAFLYTIYSMTRDIMNGEVTHCVALRKVKDTVKDSVFVNLLWAIDKLGLSKYWGSTTSPMKIWFKGREYDETSTILFRGCANQRDYEKIKSIKFLSGYCKYVIFEEWTEFTGIDETMSINQSLFRGGDEAIAMYMYNPPASKNNWVNKEVKKKVAGRYVHESNYLEAPVEWLGKIFIDEAENCKKYNPRKYDHMYMGKDVGEGLEIYPEIGQPNGVLEFRTITDEEINKFDDIRRGLDFGYSHATCYSGVYYDFKYQTVYVIEEVYLYSASNETIAEETYKKAKNYYIRGDNEDPRTINELNILGLNVGKTKKGPDSKKHGIKWLKDRFKIVIDKKRTPNIANDFETYEYKKDKDGNIITGEYPDEPDGSASVRYALEDIILEMKLVWGK